MTRLKITYNHSSIFPVVLTLVLFVWLFGLQTDASKTYPRNEFSQDQARNYYPADYKRFRRGYNGVKDEHDFKSFQNFPGTFRKSNTASGKGGGARTFPTGNSRGFQNFGGPDAFLSSGGPEDDSEDEPQPIQFGGSSGGFPSFGSSSSWSSSSNAKGKSKGGGIKNTAAAKVSQPTSVNFGPESSLFGGSSGSKFNFGSSSSFGNSGGVPTFGSSGNASPFGNSGGAPGFGGSQGPSFGSFGGSSQGRAAFSSGGSKTFSGGDPFPMPGGGSSFPENGGSDPFPVPGGGDTFPAPGGGDPFPDPFRSSSGGDPFRSSGGGDPFPDPFRNSGGSFNPEATRFGAKNTNLFSGGGSSSSGSSTSFGSLGKIAPFPGNFEDLSGGKIVGPLKNFPDLGSIDFNAFLNQLEQTTTKQPIRIISEEDRNKIFSGEPEGENSAETDLESILNFGIQGDPKGRGKKLTPNKKQLKTCDDNPEAPANAAVKCTSYSGCIIDCNPNYRTLQGDSRVYLKCTDGEWKIVGKENSEISDCEPICEPPCQNNAICLAPYTCKCPDNFEGPLCDQPKETKVEQCLSKPPTPVNSKIYCGQEECIARCIDGYQFENGLAKLTFQCEKGKWAVKKLISDKIPSCKAICDSPCTNGGICIAPNLCECSKDFRGPQCQYPISNCDPVKLSFNGGYNCSGEGMNFKCKLWCPTGADFKSPAAAEFYKCDYATGKWSPMPIPQCNYGFLPTTDEFSMQSKRVVHHGQSKPTSGVCFTWSGSHYNSFDGKVYSFESGCPYTFLQDAALGTFSVNLVPEEGCRGPKCKRALKLFTEGDQYLLQNSGNGQPLLTYRDTSLAIPGQMNGLVTERVAHFVVIKLAGIGLTLKWDLENLVIAEVSELLWNRTSGLCGRLDGSVNNDWSYADGGSSEVSLSTFLKAFEATTVGEPCLEPSITTDSCSKRTEYKADAFCSRLSDDPRFEICRSIVHVDPYVAACKWDYCSCNKGSSESCSCDSFAAFFRECTNKGGAVEEGWRSEDLCPMKCESGLEFKSCMPAIQPRCGQAAETAKPEFCVEGCDCPAGLVLNAALQCIDPSECPCTYHNKTYSSGDNIPNDCNSCTCLAGEWVCTEVKCGARCSAVGDPHYTTFDGRKFDFMGKCSYYLVKGGDFSIEAENVACAGAISEAMNFPSSVVSQFPSCTKSVTIRIPGTTVHLKQGREVTINGEEITDLPLWASDIFVKKASNLFLMVYLPNGIEVWWDGHTRAYIDAPAELRGLTAGLCGTFNDNQKDDFFTPEGDIEQNPVAFANKWKTSEKCIDVSLFEDAHPCDRHAQNKEVSAKYCAKFKSKIFAECHLEVDPEPFYRDCLYDMCSCEAELKDCVCPILATYGKECAQKGILVDWRSKIRECGLHCTGGQVYQICGDSCSHTCFDIATNPKCKTKCVEGCNCPKGFSLDVNEKCVPISQCPCVYQGKEYKPAYEMFQTDMKDFSQKLCKCERGRWGCRDPTDVEKSSPEFFSEPQLECLEARNEVYTDCMPEEEPNCLTMHLRPEQETEDLCRPGCRCETGYVRDKDTQHCIPYSECPCHHGGKSYQEGDSIVEECNSCVCENGLWGCTSNPCPAMCTAWGDSHYKTFDGRMFDFHGTCDYMLAKGKRSRNDVFEVSIQNVPCGTNGVTCAKSLTLRVGPGENQEMVQFSRNKPTPEKNMSRIIIREAGLFIIAEVADMGLELQWDKGTRGYVILDPSWKGEKVQGLCGNYNGDEKDDFRTPSGGTGEASAKIFGDSWRLQNYCPESILIKDTCSLHPHRKVWAAEKCSVLKSSTFKPCHSEVPVEPYIERCQFDSCGCDTGGDCACLCTAIAAYAHECNIHGVYVKWRTPNLCPMQCDESCEHYEPCIPTCPKETCDSYKEPQSTLCRKDVCVEGCAKDVCVPGQVHKSATDKKCLPIADCDKKCLEIDGEIFLEGDVISEDDCHTCYCTKNKKICKGTPCEPSTFVSFVTTRVTLPSFFSSTTPWSTEGCRTGWTVWINSDHPIIFKKNTDVELIPDEILQTTQGNGFCTKDMFADIKCRTVGDHELPKKGVVCNLEEGLKCKESQTTSKGGRKCADYEISLLCDCSREPVFISTTMMPETPVTAPTVVLPSTWPPFPSVPESCETEGWSPWFNSHKPIDLGEFETVELARETQKLCPEHYVKDVECRPVVGRKADSSTSCSKKGAICRNNVGANYCVDYEIRVYCECQCQDGLGMETGEIPSERITASSSTSPEFGRLNSDSAWTPETGENRELSDSWLQIDLQSQKEVTGVITQGHPYKRSFVTAFAVQVSKTGTKWEEVRDPDADFAKRFEGNANQFEEVANLLPKPVFVRYVRIIPLAAVGLPALRVELTGCNETESEGTLTTPSYLPGRTKPTDIASSVPFPKECSDGWTEWMNSHTPSPGDWDDLDNYSSLRWKYAFCDESSILRVECRVSTTETSMKDAKQNQVACNKNSGLQCVDEMQSGHCYDYEIRFYCDCSTTTPHLPATIPPLSVSTTPKDVIEVGEPCVPDPAKPTKPHSVDCQKFHECHPTWTGNKYIEKSCGPGTLYNPRTFVCDHPAVVIKIRPECGDESVKIPVTTVPSIAVTKLVPVTKACTDHYWTDWYNISHPEVDNGDIESIKSIREADLGICDQEFIMEIECQFHKIIQQSGASKGAKKGGISKGRGKPERYSTAMADYNESDDLGVVCSTTEGLLCHNKKQTAGRKCEDYAIRLFCSCESKRILETSTVPSFALTTDHPVSDYTDMRTAHPTTEQLMYMDGSCPPGRYYEKYAIKCTRVCIFYRQFLMQQGLCLDDDDEAPACIDEVTGTACPAGFFLRDNSTCVSITNCNCMLPNGMSAPPERTFLVADCEICKCTNNNLVCDNSNCYDKSQKFDCNKWSPWLSVSAPSGQGDVESMDLLRRYHPDVCMEPARIECRETKTGLPWDKAGQKVTCNTRIGFECLNVKNPGGCKDYEVRLICKCPEPETPPPAPHECVEPYWTEWFNVTHPRIKGGDYELLDVIRKDGLEICPKEFISKIECAFYKETSGSSSAKGKKKGGKKGQPARLTSLVDYTQSDDMYVTCSKFSGLTCVNSLQTKSKRCEDYAIRVFCECDSPDGFDPKEEEEVTPHGTTSTTPYPGWPLVGPQCDADRVKVECAIPCSRVCMFYEHYLQLNGECELETGCASACMNPYHSSICPEDHLYLSDNSTCVEVADCTCRLPNGRPVPGGAKIQVSKCEWCECMDNYLYCDAAPGCVDGVEPTVEASKAPDPSEVTPRSGGRDKKIISSKETTTTIPIFTTVPASSLIKLRCNEWTPWMNMRRTSEGDFQRIVDLRTQYEELCEKPVNISCRDAIAKVPYDQLGQTVTCSPEEGLICRNAENKDECFDYEVSVFCECEITTLAPGETAKPQPTTLPSIITTELAPCAAWSPWINEHKPWLEDGDVEYKSLQQLREKFDFCHEGQISEIECQEASSGSDISVNKGVRCDRKYGLRCKNDDQENGVCFDFRIRYYCSCGTTVAMRPTLIVPQTPTPPSVCSPENYLRLLEDVPDSAFSASSTAGLTYGPPSAGRLFSVMPYAGGGWIPSTANKNQYLEVDLGMVRNIYGFIVAGSSRINGARVTSFSARSSDDRVLWSPVTNSVLQGPGTSKEEKLILLPDPIEARYIRFLPNTWATTIALRVEVIGCSMPTMTPIPTTPRPTICNEDMGLQNGELADGQITVSSVYQNLNFFNGKQNIRLNAEAIPQISAGAWIAKPLPEQFIKFDFLEPRKLSGIVTKGRPGTEEFVETYTVRYSPDGIVWNTMKTPAGEDKVFTANYDGDTPVENLFDRVIEARYLEIRPKTWNEQIALRVEIKGCYHPYPEVTTTIEPSTTAFVPPPVFCTPCPGLPAEYYERCQFCNDPKMFNGEKCVDEMQCPCYHEGRIYQVDSTFETKECQECTCQYGGETSCEPVKCEKCENPEEKAVLTPSCTCVCKPCPSRTKLCPSSDFCLEDEKWCDGVEHCPDDEIGCPSWAPPGCPVPDCPEEWELVLELEGDEVNCPTYTCVPPEITTPMSCPPPLCPYGFNIVLVPKKLGEACPRYECEPPITTMEPYTCPPPACPDGYDVDVALDQLLQQSSSNDEDDENAGCPQYKCITNSPPTAPCPPPSCPQGYDVHYTDKSDLLSFCPAYQCVPIMTTTPCPPVECPKGLQTMFIQSEEGELCPQYTCIRITTPRIITTPMPTASPCREVALPVCELGEEIYQTNPNDQCPIFACKGIGAPPPTMAASRVSTPTCKVIGKDFTTFDGSQFRLDPCEHILARDKVTKEWQISIHKNCSEGLSCGRFVKITDTNHTTTLNHDLSVTYDGHTYSIVQTQKIGETSKAFTISKVGDSIIFISKTHNYTVVFNVENNIHIEVDNGVIYQVDGLCGFYTGSPVDDRTKPDGSLATSTKEYGDSWSLMEGGCKEVPEKCSATDSKKAFIMCNALTAKPFTECHDVLPPVNYLKGCVDKLCVCLKENKTEEECKCGVLSSYVTACLELKPNAKIADWRIVTKCYKECPSGEQYQDCFKAPCEKSCETLKDSDSCVESKEGSCKSGCFCKPGLVRKDGICIMPEECRDCICEGYGDPHYRSFDRKNFTFNGRCSYVAARDIDPTGKHDFQVIVKNEHCQKDKITMCTESVKVLFEEHEILIELLPTDTILATIDGSEIKEFPYKEPWLVVENPGNDHIILLIPKIQLEVKYSKDNYGFVIRVPSHLFGNKLEGLCGNCDFDPANDFRIIDGSTTESAKEFGLSWLIDSKDADCKVLNKEDVPCIPRIPEEDPCLKLMDKDKFGECHPLEDPVAYVSSCQLDLCVTSDPLRAACQSYEAYSRRCGQLGVCLEWRNGELADNCPKKCPEGLEYAACGPGCVKTCENYEQLNKDPTSCKVSPTDGCFCPQNMVNENGTCISESSCITCDKEGHRVGETWKTDDCTTCECSEAGGAICRTKSCPHELVCNEGYALEDIIGTDDACCGSQKTCKIIPATDCTKPIPQTCDYGKRQKLLEVPGLCPEYVCVCLEAEDCPLPEMPSEDTLKLGEKWEISLKGCCPQYVANCTGICPSPECPEFYDVVYKELKSGECCQEFTCEPPKDSCIYEPRFTVEDGFERPLRDEELKEKNTYKYKVGEKWLVGLCIECECTMNNNNKPASKCLKKTCPSIDEHPDRKDYTLEEIPVPGTCCPQITRTSCITDGEMFQVNETKYDPINGCRSYECKPKVNGDLEKVEQIFSCDENCPLGWEYQPSPLAPIVCCGSCVQVACEDEGELKEIGQKWTSDDFCTEFECVQSSSNNKIQTRSKEIRCTEPTELERTQYVFLEKKIPEECCKIYTRDLCRFIGDESMKPGQELTDPSNKCLKIACEDTPDGNVTRKEKEQTCSKSCSLGHIYMEPEPDSDDCCGKCIQMQCVDDGRVHSVGQSWENPKDICYQYVCQMRDDALTTVAIKRECPYFDPECPAEKILQDPTGCCKLCNVTRETKKECAPEEIDPKETVGMFILEARTVGRCTNPNPVKGFRRCNGQCDSRTVFRAQGIDARHVSECDCCRPSKMAQIEVVLQCNRGYNFQRVYDNVEACECQPCASLQRDEQYLKDQPLEDPTEFHVPLSQDILNILN